MLWAFTLLACALAVGSVAFFFLILLFTGTKYPPALLAGPVVFAGFAAAGFNELRKIRPRTIPFHKR
jgi:hypothetical protein